MLAGVAQAEAIRLKNGMIINGSIVGQTEYVLSVQTSYGTISINQREVDTIMPDLHRVLLKGGGEYVGTVLDLDEFNLSLKTDKGVVNIDVAQIASMDIYDYGEAEKQKKYVEKKVELEQEALKAVPDNQASAATAAEVAAGGTLSTSGLAFDPDLEKAFPSKPVVVEQQQIYNYRLNTYQGEMIDTPDTPRDLPPAPEEEETTEQAKIKEHAYNYFGVNLGVLNMGLKLKNLSSDSGDMQADLGGSSVAFGVEYRRRLKSYLWVGGNLSFGFIPKQYLTIVPDEHEMKITGQMIDLDILANLYLNPKSNTRVYFVGGFGGNLVNIDKNDAVFQLPQGWMPAQTQSASAFTISGIAGAGVERSIGDINLGLELRGHFNPYGGDLTGSRNINIFALLKASWFF